MNLKEEREAILWEFRRGGMGVGEARHRLPLFSTRANRNRWLRMEEAGELDAAEMHDRAERMRCARRGHLRYAFERLLRVPRLGGGWVRGVPPSARRAYRGVPQREAEEVARMEDGPAVSLRAGLRDVSRLDCKNARGPVPLELSNPPQS